MMTFLAQIDYHDLMSLLLPIVVVTLSMSIPIVAIITEHLQKKERMRLTAIAIEHGANLDNLNFESECAQPRLPYRGGMVTFAVGLALMAADRYVGLGFGEFQFPLLIGGLITGFVGLALLINDWLNREHLAQEAQQAARK